MQLLDDLATLDLNIQTSRRRSPAIKETQATLEQAAGGAADQAPAPPIPLASEVAPPRGQDASKGSKTCSAASPNGTTTATSSAKLPISTGARRTDGNLQELGKQTLSRTPDLTPQQQADLKKLTNRHQDSPPHDAMQQRMEQMGPTRRKRSWPPR